MSNEQLRTIEDDELEHIEGGVRGDDGGCIPFPFPPFPGPTFPDPENPFPTYPW
jgi:hypothetical protein